MPATKTRSKPAKLAVAPPPVVAPPPAAISNPPTVEVFDEPGQGGWSDLPQEGGGAPAVAATPSLDTPMTVRAGPVPLLPDQVRMKHADGRTQEIHKNSIEIMQGLGWTLVKGKQA